MSIVLNSAGGGSITLNEPNTASNRVLELPNNSGTLISTGSTFAGNGPAFSAYMSANQSLSATTFTKMQCNTEEFDTASCYDVSLYRFTPNVSGYYQVNGNIETVGAVGSLVSIYKNGSLAKRGANITPGAYTYGSVVSTLIYLNGSTDYIELYAYAAGAATLVGNSSQVCFFQAALVRGA
jgi:hypothetical protein